MFESQQLQQQTLDFASDSWYSGDLNIEHLNNKLFLVRYSDAR